jgi:hypothetical protein
MKVIKYDLWIRERCNENMLSFEKVFNVLALFVVKIQNNAKIETEDNKEYINIKINSLELAYSNINYEYFEDFLRFFLFYKNENAERLFNISCDVAKDKNNEEISDFLNHRYKLSLEKPVAILLQEWFYNLKSIFYDTQAQELFFNLLNNSIKNKTMPLIYFNGKYQIDDSLFKDNQEQELNLFYLLFINRNQNTIRLIQDNEKNYNKLVSENDIFKIKEFEAGSKEMIKSKNKVGGKNRLDKKKRDSEGKRIEDSLGNLDLTKKDDVIFQANYLKEHLFKQMYQIYCLKSYKLSRRAKAEHIFNTLVLLNEIKGNFNEEYTRKFIQKKINQTNGFPSTLIKEITEEIKDKKLIYSRISKLIAKYFKVNLDLLREAVIFYISEDEEKQYNQFKTFYENWSREFEIEAKRD